jgi:hypothetical protein
MQTIVKWWYWHSNSESSSNIMSTFEQAVKLKEEMIENLKTEQWSLHLDGKLIEEEDYQVVVLKNERTEVELGALCLKDGKAETIANWISKVPDEYNLRNAIKMIIADTASVSTGKKTGVIFRLHQMFFREGCHSATICKLLTSCSGQNSPRGDGRRACWQHQLSKHRILVCAPTDRQLW